MKKLLLLAVVCFGFAFTYFQQPVWKKEQIMPTQELADKIRSNAKDLPIVFNVGPMEQIKTAKKVGLGTSISGVEKMKSSLSMENKNKSVVIYCGCCSYANCPNLKPAYDALVSAGFKNTKILEIPEGIKPDWVAKGYPMEEE